MFECRPLNTRLVDDDFCPAELDPADCYELDRAGEKGNRDGQTGLHGRALFSSRHERRPGRPDGERDIRVYPRKKKE